MLLDYANRPGESIADPWYTGYFDITYREILEGCTGLLEKLMN
jgi:protein-tyrosine phosphatase